jgi:polyhydroxyalkanoate synthesis regulator phasin
MPPAATTVDADAASVLAIAVEVQLVDALVRKGVLTNDEAIAIYSRSLANVAPEQRASAQGILQAIMPDLEVRQQDT